MNPIISTIRGWRECYCFPQQQRSSTTTAAQAAVSAQEESSKAGSPFAITAAAATPRAVVIPASGNDNCPIEDSPVLFPALPQAACRLASFNSSSCSPAQHLFGTGGEADRATAATSCLFLI